MQELENRLLIDYLQQGKSDCLRDFIAVNQSRRLKMHRETIRWEDHQQKMEGLADYVSLRAFEAFPILPMFDVKKALLHMREKKTIGLPSLLQDAVKGRHYFVGAVLAFALDAYGVSDWKTKVETENASLQQLLERVLATDSKRVMERFKQIKQRAGWNEIVHGIAQTLAKEKKEQEEWKVKFDTLEGVTIYFQRPSGHMSAGGKHGQSCQLDPFRKILAEDDSTANGQDESWVLRFKKIPLVIENKRGERWFKLEPTLILEVDGKSYQLKEMMLRSSSHMPFSTLSFVHSTCEFHASRPGRLVVQKDGIAILFD